LSVSDAKLDEMASSMGTISYNTSETVATIRLKKVREKSTATRYNSITTVANGNKLI